MTSSRAGARRRTRPATRPAAASSTIGDHDVRAAPRQLARDRGADARARSGDDGRPALEGRGEIAAAHRREARPHAAQRQERRPQRLVQAAVDRVALVVHGARGRIGHDRRRRSATNRSISSHAPNSPAPMPAAKAAPSADPGGRRPAPATRPVTSATTCFHSHEEAPPLVTRARTGAMPCSASTSRWWRMPCAEALEQRPEQVRRACGRARARRWRREASGSLSGVFSPSRYGSTTQAVGAGRDRRPPRRPAAPVARRPRARAGTSGSPSRRTPCSRSGATARAADARRGRGARRPAGGRSTREHVDRPAELDQHLAVRLRGRRRRPTPRGRRGRPRPASRRAGPVAAAIAAADAADHVAGSRIGDIRAASQPAAASRSSANAACSRS